MRQRRRVTVVAPTVVAGWSIDWISGETGFWQAQGETVGALATIADRGTLGADWVQATGGKQPSAVATGGPLDGPRIRFAGGDVVAIAGDPLGAFTESHAFVVLKVDKDPALDSDHAQPWTMGTGIAALIPFTTGIVYENWGSGIARGTFADPGTSLASWCVYEVTSVAPTGLKVFVNGSQVGATAFAGTNTVNFPTTLYLGGIDATPTKDCLFDVAEILQADHVLTTAERLAYVAHLLADYGIVVA